MTAAKGWRRLGIAIVAVVAAGIGAFALLPYFIPAAQVRDKVKAQIEMATGLDPVLRGPTTVSLFPSASVIFGDVVLGDDNSGQPALAAERLTAQLRLLPLLVGRIEIADVSLVRPRILVRFDSNGLSNWSELVDTLARTMKPGSKKSDRVLSFSQIRIADGTIIVQDSARRIEEALTGVELSLAWPSISQSLGATGRFFWHDEPVDVSVNVGDLFAALIGERAGLKMRLTSARLNVAFDGHISRRPNFGVQGTLAADAPSLRRALIWAGQQPLPGGGFGRFAMKAQTNVLGTNVALPSVNIELDGNAAEGVLTFTMDERPTLQGTLAADAVNFSPYVSTVRILRQNQRDWNRGDFGLDGLAGMDLDIRLSAAKIALGDAEFGRTAIAANLRGGRLTITIGESQAFGGVLKGSVGLSKLATGADFKAQLQFTDVDLEKCLNEMLTLRRIEGRGDLALNIEGSGSSVLEMTKTLKGQASLNARQGAISGINIEQALRQLQRRPLSASGELRSGRTPFEKLSVTLKIERGVATVDDVRFEGPAIRLAVAGSASIPTRDLDLKGTASLVASATEDRRSPFELPFVVQGPWDDPIMLPDAESLIRHSRATAPLLDALKRRKGEDAIRSAIEKFTGGSLLGLSGEPAAETPAPSGGAAPAPAPSLVPASGQ